MLQTVILALIQSAAEFLPISSSAHLILAPKVLNWNDQGMATDVVLHLGTLISVLIYFRKDVAATAIGCLQILQKKLTAENARLALKLATACLPVFVIGLAFHSYIEENFRSTRLIATTAIVFGLLLYVADKKGKSGKTVEAMSLTDAFIIGAAQVLALIPGVSRSGITMTAARMIGVTREESARFSMLLSIPTIAGAGLLTFLNLSSAELSQTSLQQLGTGAAVSFAGGILAIAFLMKWLKKASFAIFAIYRVLLGISLFYLY